MTDTLHSVSALRATSAMTAEEKKVVLASSFGALLEWYDFYIYAALAVQLGHLFFPKGNETAAFLASLATFGAGFLIRPIGALFFGRLGDMVGRKKTFLVTIILMGVATVGVGLLPTYDQIGIAATYGLVLCRLLQGLALGGEVGGAVTYVAEHSPVHRRGAYTSSLQTTATLGLLSSIIVVFGLKLILSDKQFHDWGWRLPFVLSLLLLIVSVYFRAKLHESPTFQRMKAAGATSRAPVTESFTQASNLKCIVLLFVVAAGLGAIFGTGHFYSMFFLNKTLKVPMEEVQLLIGPALVVVTPLYVFFGWLSDRIGRKPIMALACLLAAVTTQPIFKGLTHYANPGLERFLENADIVVTARDCNFRLFAEAATECDKVTGLLADLGVQYRSEQPALGAPTTVKIAGRLVEDFNPDTLRQALVSAGWPSSADPSKINRPAVFGLLFVLVLYLAMVYGPMAAFMVELFPARIRYTSLSFPFHVGAGWVGGMLSFVVTAMNVYSGNPYFGLWYPVIVSGFAFVVAICFVPETRGRPLD
ncbi:MFS transporter [Bradyrhizobium uaiense]|uniref:MHS family MFS transporter n=1 Tax=Bradyrhizobium uaiense TaxID=2594946 RepID=A0A6P1BS62_9BRAD|nr:MFS transporter [Bradyrhizobium uaiense]NEV00402.1 MHS family MFS transporter [Bradyrhizobium uaiense]